MESMLRSSIKGRRLGYLLKNENFSSFNSWKQNLEFQLTSCVDVFPNLTRGFTCSLNKMPNIGPTNDGADAT